MVQALAGLPPVLISDPIGIQPRTAERFAALAGENWADYLASRPLPACEGHELARACTLSLLSSATTDHRRPRPAAA